jgi:hypothetical protein
VGKVTTLNKQALEKNMKSPEKAISALETGYNIVF